MAKTRKQPTIKPAVIVPPSGGLNTIDAGLQIPDGDCPLDYNCIGAENGVRSRLGYQEWVTGLLGAADNTVRSIMAFHGSVKSGANDRLFCATQAGIYDVSASTQAPGAKKITYGTQTVDAGFGTWWITTTPAIRALIHIDEENGYFIYTEGTDTWAQVTLGGGAGQVSGVNPNLFVGGTFFKNRNWFVQKDSTLAWYLPAGAVFGAATAFDFGSKFKNGGVLVGLYNWAYDGGSGPDNYLVAISSGGDIVVYQGTDPASTATFQLRAVWYTGGVPYGRQLATDNGGDMLVLTSSGVLSLSKLVVGNPAIDRTMYSTYKINNLFTTLVDAYGTLQGWRLRFHPNDGSLLVMVPQVQGQATNQLAMSLITKGWSKYRNLPILCGESWNRKFYFGTHDGRICVGRDYVDNVTLASGLTAYTPVDYSFITKTDNFGSVGQKIPSQIRLTLLAQEPNPSVNAEVRFNFDQTEAAVPLAQQVTGAGAGATWDVSKWDQSVWSGDFVVSQKVFGAAGRGNCLAVAVRGQAQARTIISNIELLYTEGGFL